MGNARIGVRIHSFNLALRLSILRKTIEDYALTAIRANSAFTPITMYTHVSEKVEQLTTSGGIAYFHGTASPKENLPPIAMPHTIRHLFELVLSIMEAYLNKREI